jgi:predicted ATPase/DNA-binding winged helix-turn-helix (wHTH) protein
MASRHKVVKLRSKDRHVTVTPFPWSEPRAPWQLDLDDERLRRGEETIALPPKAFAVLRYLQEHPGRLVTKQELLDAVWSDVAVTEAVLKNCILTLRTALSDDAKTPRYIETVHRRGYRLLTPLTTTAPAQRGAWSVEREMNPPPPTALRSSLSALRLVGRESELEQLQEWYKKALSGERQLVFVTGEPGIGKTALVEVFLSGIREQSSGNSSPAPTDPCSPTPVLWISRGQCIEHYGSGEAYLPILSALGQLCRSAEGKQIVSLLSQHAPMWLVQMPGLLTKEEFEALQRKTAGAAKERMLREIAEALEVLTAEQPLVLVLEDLHWSDPSTLDLLAFVARRSQPARLLILGTYRPAEMLAQEHPLRRVVQELQLHRHSKELPLNLLTEADVAAYLARRCSFPSPFQGESQGEGVSATPFHDLAWVIHQRTEGNPLFMVNVVDDLLARGEGESANVEINAPTTIRQLIERQFERLSLEDQYFLEAATAAGIEFSAAAVAAGSEAPIEVVERRCATLARQGQFLHPAGVSEWPDGTRASRYAFQHALYQEVLYERVTAARKVTLHRRIGEREEQAYGNRAAEIAAELAVHFERGRDYLRATQYLQYAAENAQQKNAYQEAISLATRGLQLLTEVSDTPERIQQELRLQLTLGGALGAVKGYSAPEVENALTQARAMSQKLGETPQLFPVLGSLFVFYVNRTEVQTAHELAEQMMRLAQSAQNPLLLPFAHAALGGALFLLGELTSARTHMEQASALYDPQQYPRFTGNRSDLRVDCLSYRSHILWFLGYPDQALKLSEEAIALAEELSHPFSLAFALGFASLFHLYRRDEQTALARAEAVMTLATEQGFPYWLAFGLGVRDCVLAEQGQMEERIARMRRNKLTPPPALLAEVCGRVGQVEEGLALITKALAAGDRTGVRVNEADLYRVKGELLLLQFQVSSSKFQVENPQSVFPNPQSGAEACFHKAIEIAQRQQAKSLELRAVMSLSHLWQQQGKEKEAHRVLSEIYNWFTEGFDTKDLQEAKAFLEDLGQ